MLKTVSVNNLANKEIHNLLEKLLRSHNVFFTQALVFTQCYVVVARQCVWTA